MVLWGFMWSQIVIVFVLLILFGFGIWLGTHNSEWVHNLVWKHPAAWDTLDYAASGLLIWLHW